MLVTIGGETNIQRQETKADQHKSLQSLTLYFWDGFLVLVWLTTEHGEGKALQHARLLVNLRFLAGEQVQGARLGHCHTRCKHYMTLLHTTNFGHFLFYCLV